MAGALELPGPRTRTSLLFRSKRLGAAISAAGALGGALFVIYKAVSPANLDPVDAAAKVLNTTDPKLAQQLVTLSSDLKGSAIWLAVIALIWVAIVQTHGFYRAMVEDATAADRGDPHHLRAPLLLLDTMVRKRRQLGSSGEDLKKFRATLHKAGKGKHIQCIPYVGWDERSRGHIAGRSWQNSCGLVGKVIRRGGGTLKPLISTMPDEVKDEESYWEALRDAWGYEISDARKHAPMRLEAVAVPITDGNDSANPRVIGVPDVIGDCYGGKRAELYHFFIEELPLR